MPVPGQRDVARGVDFSCVPPAKIKPMTSRSNDTSSLARFIELETLNEQRGSAKRSDVCLNCYLADACQPLASQSTVMRSAIKLPDTSGNPGIGFPERSRNSILKVPLKLRPRRSSVNCSTIKPLPITVVLVAGSKIQNGCFSLKDRGPVFAQTPKHTLPL